MGITYLCAGPIQPPVVMSLGGIFSPMGTLLSNEAAYGDC